MSRRKARRPFAARRSLVLGFATLAVLGAGLFGWGAFSSISGAVIAAGRVEVETRDQVVENVDGGTVAAILVRDGDRVAAGDVVLRFGGEALLAEEALLAAQLADLVARRNRLEAEFLNADTIAWDGELEARALDDPAIAAILDGQARLFAARRESRSGEVAQLRERIGQMRRQIAGLEAQGEAVVRQRGFLARELDAQRELFAKKLTELHRLMGLEREAARLEGQAGEIEARIAGVRGRIAEIEIEILRIGTRRIEEAEGRAREVQAREHQARERLREVRRRLGTLAVRAPVAGEVYGMRVSTLGEVVRPGEPILHLVPEGAALVVRARVEPIHVDQVRAGQDAVLLFSAFPARVTPEYAGRIVRVSADAQRDERTGLDWYEVEVAIRAERAPDGTFDAVRWLRSVPRAAAAALPEDAGRWLREGWPGWFGADGPAAAAGRAADRDGAGPLALALAPGMPVEVHVRTGERTPLSYLAKPLTDYFTRSMREE